MLKLYCVSKYKFLFFLRYCLFMYTWCICKVKLGTLKLLENVNFTVSVNSKH